MSLTSSTENNSSKRSAFVDEFESPDFYQIDDLLTDEQKLVRSAMRDFVTGDNTIY